MKTNFIWSGSTVGREHLERFYVPGVGRMYRLPSGESFVSATTFLSLTDPEDKKKGLQEWRESVGPEKADRISKAAVDRGNEIHRIMEDLLNNKGYIKSETQPIANLLTAKVVPDFVRNLGAVHGTEVRLYSRQLGICGTCDLVADYDGKLSIIDYKGSSKEKKREWITGYFTQTLLYAFMWYEMTGDMPQQLVVPVFAVEGDSHIFTAEPKEFVHEVKHRIGIWANIKDGILGSGS